MRVEGRLCKDDLRAYVHEMANRKARKHGRRGRHLYEHPFRHLLVIVFLASLATALSHLYPFGGAYCSLVGTLRTVLYVLWGVVALVGFGFFYNYVLLPNMLAKQPGVFDTRVFAVEQDGLRETSTTGDTLLRWSGMTEIIHETEHVFIYRGPAAAHVIPRRFFATEAEERNFLGALGQGFDEGGNPAKADAKLPTAVARELEPTDS